MLSHLKSCMPDCHQVQLLILSVCGFTLSCVVNICILMILYNSCLLPT